MRRARRLLLIALSLLVVLLALFGVLSLDWRHEGSATPRVVSAWRATGVYFVGAGKASLIPPFPAPISGFNTRGGAPFHNVQSPLEARAIVLEVRGRRVGLLSVETVALPFVIREQVIAATKDLRLDEVLIAATHAHSGVGGYWNKMIAEQVGLGPYDARVEAFFVGQLVAALRQASGSLQPARLTVGEREVPGFSYNRNDAKGAVDTRLTSARFDGADGKTFASLIVFAAHPTIINRVDMALSGDWPGALMRSIETRTNAPALFFQGALGDATWVKSWGPDTGQATANRFGEALGQSADAALRGATPTADGPMSWSRVRIGLPKCDVSALVPPLFGPIVSNAFCWAAKPGDTDVSFFQLGPLALASLPGEPVAALGLEWRKELGGATIVGLADDYVGYIEASEVMQARSGETKRTYFGATLAGRVLDGLKAAREAASKAQ